MDAISVNTDRKGNLSAITDTEANCSLRKKVEGRKILKKKLKVAEKENEDLKHIVNEKDVEIDTLKANISSLNDMINSVNVENLGRGSSVASTKIMDLSKKNRQLIAELELVKSKYTKLDAKYAKLEKAMNESIPKPEPKETARKVACCNSSSKLESLTDQLTATKQKLFESLNQTAELKSSLKLAQKCIQQEIGENINLTTLAASASNWRGRAQQIMTLQHKIAELKERLESTSLGDEPIKQQIRKMEALKKAEIDELAAKINEFNAIIEDQKKKIAALKIRNKNLCEDAMNYKLKTLNLIEKTGSSDNSIAVLQEKINMQKFQYENRMAELRKEIEAEEEKLRKSEEGHSQTRAKLKNMDNVVKEKDAVVEGLQDIIKQLENDLKAVCGDFLFSCREFKKEEFIAILDALECEKEGLLKHIKELDNRIECEREKVTNLNEQLSKHRIKYIRLESRLKELQKEQELQQDKKKRSQRATDYARSLSGGMSTLIFENSNSCLFDTTASGDGYDLQIEDMKNKLELANERITFLEEKLAHTLNEKQNDSETFNEIINSSKNSILQILLEARKSGSILNLSDSLNADHNDVPNEYQQDSLEEASNCSRIFSQVKVDA